MATPKKRSAARRPVAGSKKLVTDQQTVRKKSATAKKKAGTAGKETAAKKLATNKTAKKKVAVKKAASKKASPKKAVVKNGTTKKAGGSKSAAAKKAVKKAVPKKTMAKNAVSKKTIGSKQAAPSPVKKGTKPSRATRKAASRASGKQRSSTAGLKGLPPLIRPSAQGETVIVEDITITDGKEIVFEMELIYTERVVSNEQVFDLHTQRDDKGQLIIDVYQVRKDGLVGIPDHRRIIFIGEDTSAPLGHDDYLQEYAALKQLLADILLPE